MHESNCLAIGHKPGQSNCYAEVVFRDEDSRKSSVAVWASWEDGFNIVASAPGVPSLHDAI